ncbi:MAG TPA: hypothetical protein VFK13_08370 [Gemmatimonadaceae bacterium]|nr:hypothetical protein [Gemmatimonadaceae bacterium]
MTGRFRTHCRTAAVLLCWLLWAMASGAPAHAGAAPGSERHAAPGAAERALVTNAPLRSVLSYLEQPPATVSVPCSGARIVGNDDGSSWVSSEGVYGLPAIATALPPRTERSRTRIRGHDVTLRDRALGAAFLPRAPPLA